ncbi:MAG TPA: RsmE family RNA methyltransferase [Fimbriimonadaceae bacterium]|nr:RsmE family RNA methyltransferase [Fimbriimonadaceae bacterium]HRJ96996.1 RsmE family RNA methyltransferase [Fimbriimonadaceae bacterium]
MPDLPLRALPRLFLDAEPDEGIFELPKAEIDKLRKVLRLPAGAHVACLPGNGRIFRCVFEGHVARVLKEEAIETEPRFHLTIAQAIPKPEKLDEVVRMGTEIGVSEFVVFPSERTVVRWDEAKMEHRLTRLRAIAREAAEVCFRARLPKIAAADSLAAVLEIAGDALVLSEQEGVPVHLMDRLPGERAVIVIGPEGGWAPREVERIGPRAVTLGPRVLRVDTAAAAAAALILLGPSGTPTALS